METDTASYSPSLVVDAQELFRLLAGHSVGESDLAVLTNESAAAAVALMEGTEIRLVCLAQGRSADAGNATVRGRAAGPPMPCEK
jgi:hypothetical protein